MKKSITIVMLFIISLVGACISASAQNLYLYIGTDSRTPEKSMIGNADMIMIMAIKDKSIALASIMRDTYVNVPGYGFKKINAAYLIGGPKLLKETIALNFGVQIKNHILIDFANVPAAVDILGGVDVDLSETERLQLNKYVLEQNNFSNKKYEPITRTGKGVMLNGGQTLAYSRIRNDGDGDRGRTERQQEIMNNILRTIKRELNFKELVLSFDRKLILNQVEKLAALQQFFNSDMPYKQFMNTLLLYGQKKFDDPSVSLEPTKRTFPLEKFSYNKKLNGSWYVMTDNVKMGKDLRYYLSENKYGKYN